MPDIITFCDLRNGRSFVALIDAKACRDRPNYAIEMSAIETAEIYTDRLFTPTFFVFDDFKVLTPSPASAGQSGQTAATVAGRLICSSARATAERSMKSSRPSQKPQSNRLPRAADKV
jgi:hypothetical protein